MCQAHYRSDRKYGTPYGTPNPKKPGPPADPTKPRSRYREPSDNEPKSQAVPTHCKRGHILDAENLRYNTKGARYCGRCAAENSQRSRKAADPEYGTRRDKYSPEVLSVQNSLCRKGHVVTAETVLTYADGTRRCRTCSQEWSSRQRLSRYGLTIEDYESLLSEQNGVCAICNDPMTTYRNQHIDHDHLTGQVRGILCSQCNTAIGKFKDSPEIIIKAAEYIMKSWGKSSA